MTTDELTPERIEHDLLLADAVRTNRGDFWEWTNAARTGYPLVLQRMLALEAENQRLRERNERLCELAGYHLAEPSFESAMALADALEGANDEPAD